MWSNEGKSTRAARVFQSEEGKGALDTLLVCILIGIVIAVIFPYYHMTVKVAKEVALQAGLVNIRKTIQLYQFMEHQYPPDLGSLTQKRLVLPAREDTFFKKEYLSSVAADPEGHLLDPFGNRYRYDPRNGRVSSGTPGYETW